MRKFFFGAASLAAVAFAWACAGSGNLGDTCSSNSDCPKVNGQQSVCLNQNGGPDGGPGYMVCEPPGACSVDTECAGQASGSCNTNYTQTGQEQDFCVQVGDAGPNPVGCRTLTDCPAGAIACQDMFCPLLDGGSCATSADCGAPASGFACVSGTCLSPNLNSCNPLYDQSGNPAPNLCVFPNAT